MNTGFKRSGHKFFRTFIPYKSAQKNLWVGLSSENHKRKLKLEPEREHRWKMAEKGAKTDKELLEELNMLRQRNAALEKKLQQFEKTEVTQEKNDKGMPTIPKNGTESALRQTINWLQPVIDIMPEAISVIDTEFNILYMNNKTFKVFRISDRADILGRKCYEVYKKRSSVCPECRVHKVFETGDPVIRFSTPEEDRLVGYSRKIYTEPIKDENGNITGAVEWVLDVTDVREMEKKLKEAIDAVESANRTKSEFLANMSHELRTPLHGVLGYTQILKRDKLLNNKQKRAVDTIQHSGEHLLVMIEDILEFSKIEANKAKPEPSDLYLPEFLTRIIDIVRLQTREKGIAFDYKPDPDLPACIHGDGRWLRRILLNLLSNAAKFTQKGGISFEVQSERNKKESGPEKNCPFKQVSVRFRVKDSGIGIPKKKLEEIFLPFHQVGDWRIKAEGTGLGLAISRELVRIMGGELFVKSTPDHGSTFWFELVFPEIEWKSEASVKEQKEIIGFKGRKYEILIVDDSDVNRLVLKAFLSQLGFEVIEAINGHDGLNKATALRPDMILMDLMMPVMDGFEATSEIRKMSAFRNTPIIAVSANVSEEARGTSLDAGCNDYITKPVNMDQLTALLEKYLKPEWIYAGSEEKDAPVTPPPKEDMDMLFNLTMQGDIMGIQERAEKLMFHSEFKLFGEKLCQLAKELLIDEIQEFLGQFMKKGK